MFRSRNRAGIRRETLNNSRITLIHGNGNAHLCLCSEYGEEAPFATAIPPASHGHFPEFC